MSAHAQSGSNDVARPLSRNGDVGLWSVGSAFEKLLIIIALLACLSSCATISEHPAEQDYDLALGLFNQGRYEEAIPYFRKSIEVEPKFGKAYLYLGRSYLNLGRFVDAVPPLRTAFDLAPAETKNEITNLLLDAMIGIRPRQ